MSDAGGAAKWDPGTQFFFKFFFIKGQVKLVCQMLEVLQSGTQARSFLF
jgi:hypothetical protein